MPNVKLSLAVCDYDRTRALFDGRVRIEGCDVTYVAVEPEEAFHRAFKYQEFDCTEMSMSTARPFLESTVKRMERSWIRTL